MSERLRVFIDYWNFQLNWNERAGEARCDWLALPGALTSATKTALAGSPLRFDGAHIYASVDHHNENLLNWLETFLERQPGFIVKTARLVRRQRSVRCTACGLELDECPECGEPYSISSTKGLTTSMVCDIMTLACEHALDVAVIVSSDTELVPLMRRLSDRGIKVIHAGWRDGGSDPSREAWASIDLDAMIPNLVRV
jgi:uncharacterized LabA/DUF88 family protein